MDNKEVLRLAAKACGLAGEWKSVKFGENVHETFYVHDEPWRPDLVDGAALRLLADLRLEISFFEGSQYVRAETYSGEHGADIDYTADRLDDVRNAIVYCAAEIGKSMS